MDILLCNNNNVIVIDDTVDIKIIRTQKGYELRVLNNNTCDVKVTFTDNVQEFEEF